MSKDEEREKMSRSKSVPKYVPIINGSTVEVRKLNEVIQELSWGSERIRFFRDESSSESVIIYKLNST